MTGLSLFESQHAAPLSPMHLRRVDDTGLHYGGGHTDRTLCERRITGWDIEGPVTLRTIVASMAGVTAPLCRGCVDSGIEILRSTDPNAGVPDAPVVTSAPVRLRDVP